MADDHTNWTCAETEERLSDFLDGLLAPDGLAAFERHRAGCANCAALSARVGATVSGLHGIALLEEPPELVRAILDRTIGTRKADRDARPVASAKPGVPAAQLAESEGGWFRTPSGSSGAGRRSPNFSRTAFTARRIVRAT